MEPGSYLALWAAGHVFPYDGDQFFEELQEVYDQIGESLPPGATLPRPQEVDDDRAEIEASGLFEVIDIAQTTGRPSTPTATSICRTHSREPDGLVRRHWGCVLHIARRRNA